MLDFETARTSTKRCALRNRAGGPGAELRRRRSLRPHRLVADGAGAGARRATIHVAATRGASRARGWDGWRAPAGVSAHRRPALGHACGPPTRASIDARRGSRSSATAATTSARARRRSATTCWRCTTRDAARHARRSSSTTARCSWTRWRDLLLTLLTMNRARRVIRCAAKLASSSRTGPAAPRRRCGYRVVRAGLQCARTSSTSLTRRLASAFREKVRAAPAQLRRSTCGSCVMQRPAHLLDPHYAVGAALLGSHRSRARGIRRRTCEELQRCTWGERTRCTSRIRVAFVAVRRPLARHAGASRCPAIATCRACSRPAFRRVASASSSRPATKRMALCSCRAARRTSAVAVLRCGPRGLGARQADAVPAGAAKHTLTLRPAATL